MITQPDSISLAEIQRKYDSVRARIEAAARRSGRLPDAVRLVVVTKTHPVEAVRAAIQAGAGILGENYPLEGAKKKLALGSPQGVEWHMIGHIQSRKTQVVAEHYDFIHAIERLKIVNRLDSSAGALGRRLPVLLECNVSGEGSKFGLPAWDERRWPELSEIVDACLEAQNLHLRGLMTIPPYSQDAESSRPYFKKLRRLRDYLAGRSPRANLDDLSMGMSADYEIAIEEGATYVRVGTAIMGVRSSPGV